MLSFVILVALSLTGFSYGGPIMRDSGNVAINQQKSHDHTSRQYIRSVIEYWTPERMASAIPYEPVAVDEKDFLGINIHPKVKKAPSILTPSVLLPHMENTKPSVAGKVYFTRGGLNYICSGSVVNAENKDTVVTAAHCIYDSGVQATYFMFVPQYSLGSRPLGSFVARNATAHPKWKSGRQWDYDVGVSLMNQNEEGQHVQDVAGGLGITLDAPRNDPVVSFGYPRNINSGEIVSNCPGVPTNPSLSFPFNGLRLACDMTGGSSGGPWIQEYNVDTPAGQQISVNSFLIIGQNGYLYGPYFTEDNIGELYRELQNQ